MLLVSREEAIKSQSKTYFTGKPCKHGHIDVRHTSSGQCRTCNLDRQFARSRSQNEVILLRCAKYRAKARNILFNLTIEDIVIPSHCPCCGVKLIPKSQRPNRMKTGATDSPSLDRKVPDLGYTKGNVAVLCMKCNALKAGVNREVLRFLLDYLG